MYFAVQHEAHTNLHELNVLQVYMYIILQSSVHHLTKIGLHHELKPNRLKANLIWFIVEEISPSLTSLHHLILTLCFIFFRRVF